MQTKPMQQAEYAEDGILKTSKAAKKHTGGKYKANTSGTHNKGRAGHYPKKGKKGKM